jgi:hypothetical protein
MLNRILGFQRPKRQNSTMNLTSIEIDTDKALKRLIHTNSAFKNYWDRMQLSEIK